MTTTTDHAQQDWPVIDRPDGRNSWWWAAWLLGRHPQLALLTRRALVLRLDEDGDLDVDLDALAEAFRVYDEIVTLWRDEWESWEDVRPPVSPAVCAIAPMSGSEKGRLRLLAMFAAADQRVPLNVCDLSSFDENGVRLLADWCEALLHR
jgi:hypothetical protein